MLNSFFGNDRVDDIDKQIQMVLVEMDDVGVESNRYPELITHLERLHDLKAKKRRDPVSRNTWAIIGGNLLGILIIVAYEQKHVITTKAQNMIIRPKMDGMNPT